MTALVPGAADEPPASGDMGKAPETAVGEPSSPAAQPEQPVTESAIPVESSRRRRSPAPSGGRVSGRFRQLLGGLFGNARKGAEQLLAPTPEEPVPPVPPVVVQNETKLLNHSPFSIGFFGALGVLVAIGLMAAATQVQNILTSPCSWRWGSTQQSSSSHDAGYPAHWRCSS